MMSKSQIAAVTEGIREVSEERDREQRYAKAQYLDGYVDGMKRALTLARRAA